MKKFKVAITQPAFQDLHKSYLWGCEQWGVKQAKKWLRQAKQAVYSLSAFPERHSLVSQEEQEELGTDVRQIIFQRYRILFTIQKNTVYVLHVRGAFKGDVNTEQEEADLP
jgi:plasmid stabilization system protein ParE